MKPWRLAAAALYRAGYVLHHKLCLKPGRPLAHARLIVVGSYLAGGAGKTPFCIWLASFLASRNGDGENAQPPRIAILCHSKAKDEAELLGQKLPFARVATTQNRYIAAHALDRHFDYIICDDGFEDSRLAGATTIRLDWGEGSTAKIPNKLSNLIPAGKYRSLFCDHGEAALVLRCGNDPALDNANVYYLIEGVKNNRDKSILENARAKEATVLCAIGDPRRFVEDLERFGVKPRRVKKRPDHDSRFESALARELRSGRPVVITEKDAVKVATKFLQSANLYIARQKVVVSEQIQQKIAYL